MKAQIVAKEKFACEAEGWNRNDQCKVHKHKRQNRNKETQAYLDMLQELVPFMSKNERLPETEVISNVIDYICDLRDILGLPQPNDDLSTEPQQTKVLNNSEVSDTKRNQINSKELPVSSAPLSAQHPSSSVLSKHTNSHPQRLFVHSNTS